MSLLTPLYAIGAMAVALPILFHLLQRRPRRQQDFSSLMFLTASAPRITRRSRLNHWWLLALRALALLLLAAAFARPFLRSLQQIAGDSASRRVAILVDRSASMQRPDIWAQAIGQVEAVLQGLGDHDQVALFSFDDQFRVEVGMPQNGAESTAAAADAIRAAMKQLQPGWRATDIGRALTSAVEQLHVTDNSRASVETSVVLISDLQQGAELDGLREFTWPPEVGVDVRRVVPTTQANATLRAIPPEPEATGADTDALRVRVTNEATSATDALQLVWRTAAEQTIGTAKAIQVPPGRSRVVSVSQPATAHHLVIQGDNQLFDNLVYVAPRSVRDVTVLYLGDQRSDRDNLLFFLQKAQLGAGPLRVNVQAAADTAFAAPPDPIHIPLIILAQPPQPHWIGPLHQYLDQGGRVLVVLDPGETNWAAEPRLDAPTADNSVTNNDSADHAVQQLPSSGLAALCRLSSLRIETRSHDEYAMLSEIDFRHPLFMPFVDPKFSDFTKIRFWQTVAIASDQENPWRVVAQFDDDSPALVEQSSGPGRLWILATGWRPESSQLALSTKFVPLLVTMLGPNVARAETEQPVFVGDRIDLTGRGPFDVVQDPSGQTRALGQGVSDFRDTDQIGLYVFTGQQDTHSVAVNLPPQESRTTPLDPSQLEQRGVPLTRIETAAEADLHNRQMKDVELESRQKLWRWLLASALAILAIETYVAAVTSHRELTASLT